MRRLALGLEYDGTNYNGWQIQSHAPSIQATLNGALSSVADESINCVGAGRTDTGVHATCQVVHFDTVAKREMRSWLLGINSNLPDDVNVLSVQRCTGEFHARFSATGRAYRYVILNRPVRSALLRERAWWVREPLDVPAMTAAAQCLVGEHDFSSFRASACQAHTPVRQMRTLTIEAVGDRIVLECEANAFLQHMVRNIAGTLVAIGSGEEDIAWLSAVLESMDRTRGGVAAPPHGLTLVRVNYPGEFGIPAPLALGRQ